MQTWMGFIENGINQRIENAARAGCECQILLLNPYSRQVKIRGDGLQKGGDRIQFSAQNIKDEITRELALLERIYRKLASEGQGREKNLDVRVYDAAPIFHLYDFDGSMIIGMSWRDFTSLQGPQ